LQFLNVQVTVCFANPEYSRILLLLQVNSQAQRFQNKIAKPHVGQPGLFQIDTQSKVIELRTLAAILPRRSRGKQRDLKSKLLQQSGECAVQFIAKAAAPLADNLVYEFISVEENWAVESDIEILERNREHVRPMELAKRLSRGFRRPRIAYAIQISRNIHNGWGSHRAARG
jgi:hypothetical protein